MSQPTAETNDLADLSSDYSLSPFAHRLSPLITETLRSQQQNRERYGTKLVSSFVVWLVLGLVLRRDKNSMAVLDWLMSGYRWLSCHLPKQLVSERAISHARVRVGVTVFQTLFNRVVLTFQPLVPDFHQWVSVAFDGSTGSMPDSPANRDHFGKPKSRRQGEASAYPQMRWMSLLAIGPRLLLDVAYGPYAGKGTGERNLDDEYSQPASPGKVIVYGRCGPVFLCDDVADSAAALCLLSQSESPSSPACTQTVTRWQLSVRNEGQIARCPAVYRYASCLATRNAHRAGDYLPNPRLSTDPPRHQPPSGQYSGPRTCFSISQKVGY